MKFYAILTNTNKDRIGLVRDDWHEVTAHDCDIVIINSEYERRIYRCVDKPKKIFFTLTIAVIMWAGYIFSE